MADKKKQVRGTCPICFRKYAIVRGDVARHRYVPNKEVPAGLYEGRQCLGAGREPYEVSPDGIKSFLSSVEREMNRNREELALADDWLSIYVVSSGLLKNVQIGDANWEKGKAQRIASLKASIKSKEEQIAFYQGKLDSWVKQPLRTKDGTLVEN